jgi:hypothetical protein
MKILNQTLGSDFELCVANKNREIIPCPLKLGGTKKHPLDMGEGCYRQIDLHAAEFNTPVVQTREEWVAAFEYCIQKGEEILEDYTLVAQSSHIFTDQQLKPKRLNKFGCEPSYDAYADGEVNKVEKLIPNMRTCGTHIHVGFDGDFTKDELYRFIFCMEKCVGLESLKLDKDFMRRTMYGKPGEYRVKKVLNTNIVEYRSLGSAVLQDVGKLFDDTQKAIELFNSGYEFSEKELSNQHELMLGVKELEYAE